MKLLLLMIALMPFSQHGCVSQLPQKAHGAVEETEIKCKEVIREAADECNTCTYTICTDGKEQWENGHSSCTANYCFKKEPYDKKLWEGK